jgi:hypothetical protein
MAKLAMALFFACAGLIEATGATNPKSPFFNKITDGFRDIEYHVDKGFKVIHDAFIGHAELRLESGQFFSTLRSGCKSVFTNANRTLSIKHLTRHVIDSLHISPPFNGSSRMTVG